jgi:lycopene beta-cyclase
MTQLDYVLVGGGLQNALCALAIRAHRPAARIALVERGPAPGGNHTWCFHQDDVDDEARSWIDPLIVHRWDGYQVSFPEVKRQIAGGYAAVTSERLAEVVARALAVPGSELRLGATALEVAEHEVAIRTAGGAVERLRGTVVIDARGPDAGELPAGGFQKFVGLEIRTAGPHGVERPILMDAEVPQLDGFRFFYVLPLAPDRLLVEDTRFSDGTFLDVSALRDACVAYAGARGWPIAEVVREEHGILPLPHRITLAEVLRGPLTAGMQGGWFHPTTGYSFPVAVRLAALVGALPPEALFGPELDGLRARHRRQLDVALALNRMLFGWFAPEDRHHVLARFYRLPEPTIRRFYALDLRVRDVVRIFAGRPPRGLSWRAAVTEPRSTT